LTSLLIFIDNYTMGGKIPREIKLNVIRRWLEGESRDKIAREEHIGNGTVSSIIDEAKQNDPQFDLLREVARHLKNQGLDIESFAHVVRLRAVLKENLESPAGVNGEKYSIETEEKIESLIEALELFCFRQNLCVKEFVEVIYGLSSESLKLGIPVDKLPMHIEQLKDDLAKLMREEQTKLKKEAALRDHDVTLEQIENYRRNKSLFQKIQQIEQDLENVKEERESYKQAAESEKLNSYITEQLTWAINEAELNQAAGSLGLDSDTLMPQLREMVMDVYKSPTEYIEVIKQMIQAYKIAKNSRRKHFQVNR
jgi:hypothetical protein